MPILINDVKQYIVAKQVLSEKRKFDVSNFHCLDCKTKDAILEYGRLIDDLKNNIDPDALISISGEALLLLLEEK
jgi:hypothetical protein